jgi:hypothetical protein
MIEIKCRGADTLPLDLIEDFQGGLKKRTKKEIDQIIKSIKEYGFSFPFFIWNGTGHNYCLDGHGRIQALSQMRQAGEDLPLFPVVYIDAKDEAEARQKLLRMNSNFGIMTVDSVLEFTGNIDVEWGDLSLPDGNIMSIIGLDAESVMPNLKTGDREPFQQMTFTLSDEQAATIKQAVDNAKAVGAGESEVNENSNGNALAFICEDYLGRN